MNAQRPIRLLSAINWDASIKDRFFASGCTEQPEVVPRYPDGVGNGWPDTAQDFSLDFGCSPDCGADRECGPDGCGDTCPPGCDAGETCNESTGTCECAPDCTSKQCGDDGCGGSCGACGAGENCVSGQCVAGCPDADGDGFAASDCGGTDCADGNPGINPDAEDVCGDGIDQDCSGSDEECGRPEGGCGCGSSAGGFSALILLILLGLLLRRNP